MIFNGTYTIRNRDTGEYRTFKIATQNDRSEFAPGKRIVSLLIGTDNENDYLEFGFVSDDSRKILVWKRYQISSSLLKSCYETYATMIEDLSGEGNRYGQRYELLLEKRCSKCNRKLTTPESIERGIGPICYEVMMSLSE